MGRAFQQGPRRLLTEALLTEHLVDVQVVPDDHRLHPVMTATEYAVVSCEAGSISGDDLHFLVKDARQIRRTHCRTVAKGNAPGRHIRCSRYLAQVGRYVALKDEVRCPVILLAPFTTTH
jgi:hypothetical protein